MGYRLGVDLGTTYTAAAVLRDGAAPEVVPLGTRGAAVPSVLFLSPDLGDLLVGEAAERRAATDPGRVVRQFKRRIGDPTPLLIDPSPGGSRRAEYAAHDLAAVLVQWVVARVCEREGAKPDGIAVTHPATWGPHKKDLLRGALALRGLAGVTFVTEPEAAARTYAQSGRLAAGSTLAVYDLGGGTFDAALLSPDGDGEFAYVGRPHGLADLGGIDFDDLILSHVLAALGPEAARLDAGDPVIATSLARLRRECVDAKEALSADTETEIPVLLPDIRTNVRLTRAELEAMIAPRVHLTIDALDATLASAGLTAADLTNVVLTGGSSRIPVVAQLLSAHLGAPVSLDRDVDPKMAVAIGAVLAIDATARAARAAAPAVVTDSAAAIVLAKPAVAAAAVAPAAAVTTALPAAGASPFELAPSPARPARGDSSLTGGSAGSGVPGPRAKRRVLQAVMTLVAATAVMLGGGVALSEYLNEGSGSTARQVESDGLDMATPKKKADKDAKDEESSGGSASTTPVSYRSPSGSSGHTAPAAGQDDAVRTASTGTAPSTTTTAQQASATRKAAQAPAAKAAGSSAASEPVTAEEFEAPAVVFTAEEPAELSAPEAASEPAEPAAPAREEAPPQSAGSSDSGGWSEPDAPAKQDSTPEAAPSGFSETAPPEAP